MKQFIKIINCRWICLFVSIGLFYARYTFDNTHTAGAMGQRECGVSNCSPLPLLIFECLSCFSSFFYFHYDFSFIRERRWIRSISIIIMTEWWWVDRRETANLHTYTQLLAIQFQMSSYKNVYKYEIKKENKIWAQPLRNSPEETQTIQMRKFYSPLIQSIYRFNWQEIIQYVLLHIYTYIRYMYDIRYACMQTTAASAHFVCDCDCDCLCNASLCHFAGHLSAK